MKTDPIAILEKYYDKDSKTFRVLLEHSLAVADKALKIAGKLPEFKPDLKFIKEAAILHDIGIFMTNAPGLGCKGKYPYACHGYLGGKILKKEGLPKHGLVCERHVGVGLSAENVKNLDLPMPKKDMLPVNLEEKIICLADKFFSKSNPKKEKSLESIRKGLRKFGENDIKKFNNWLVKFKYTC